jgi:hypothetical protein
VIPTERIQRLLEPSYVGGLDARTLDDLRLMKTECADYEHALSYYRRLAQARLEILEAERERRERGGTVGDLVADLPRILSSESERSGVLTTRVAEPEAPSIELRWPDGRERLVADTTLAQLPALDVEQVNTTIAELREFEREVSDLRQQLHGVIDQIEREIAARQVAGTTG